MSEAYQSLNRSLRAELHRDMAQVLTEPLTVEAIDQISAIRKRLAKLPPVDRTKPVERLTITLSWDNPPVPTRDMDWQADLGDGETPVSFGATPWDALRAMADDLEASNTRFRGVPA